MYPFGPSHANLYSPDLLASELTAAAVILQYWDSRIQPWQYALMIIAPVFAMQLIHVRVYGACSRCSCEI